MFSRLFGLIRSSSPGTRRVGAMLVDALIVVESFLVALLFRFDGSVPEGFWTSFWPFALFSAAVFVALLFEGGIYRNVLRYTGVYQGVQAASSVAIAAGVLVVADLVAGLVLPLRPTPISVVLVGSVLAYVQLVAVRLYPRIFYERSLREVGRGERALIVGAGETGVALARQLWRMPDVSIEPVGFVGERADLHGRRIEGLPVLGGIGDIESIVEEQGVDEVLIALPSAGPEEMDRVWYGCAGTRARVRVVPPLAEFLGQGSVRLRELQIQDLLGRRPVEVDVGALSDLVSGRRVVVTGAGGSIGSELSRQVSRLGPAGLILLDRDESTLHYLNEDLA